jgi:pilus assembly protein CpaE
MTGTHPSLTIDRAKGAKLRIGVLCISMDPGSRATLESLVVMTPGAHVVDNVDRRIVPREIMQMLEPFQYRICIIDFDEGMEECCRIAERLRDNCDNTINVFAASSDFSPDNILSAMRSGCTEYLSKPFDSERVSAALAHIEARRHIKDESAVPGKVVTLIGAKGGTGVTALATHLALSLSQRHKQKCLLVDQHPALGDVSLYLGLTRRQYSFYELVHNTDRLDNELLQGFVLQHESGVHVLDSPEVIDSFPHASPEAIEHTLSFLAENYQFIIIDCPPGVTDDSAAAIRQSNQLAVVITPELPAVRNALRWVEYLIGLHYPENCIDIVLNRHIKNSTLRDEEIEAALRRPIAVKIPNAYEEVARAINTGVPLGHGRNANLSSAVNQWADRLMGAEPATEDEPQQSRGWFGLFG